MGNVASELIKIVVSGPMMTTAVSNQTQTLAMPRDKMEMGNVEFASFHSITMELSITNAFHQDTGKDWHGALLTRNLMETLDIAKMSFVRNLFESLTILFSCNLHLTMYFHLLFDFDVPMHNFFQPR